MRTLSVVRGQLQIGTSDYQDDPGKNVFYPEELSKKA
jgi:hypothetical protein